MWLRWPAQQQPLKHNRKSTPSTGSRQQTVLLLLVAIVVLWKMATPRRSAQQQQQQQPPLNSLPRGASLPGSPPGSPLPVGDDGCSLPQRGAMETADGEVSPASPTTNTAASPILALTASSGSGSGSSSSASSPTTTTEASGSSSPGSTPDSGGGSGGNGAFRELFEACRNGDVSRVKKLVDAVNVNAKDMAGRKSTPLHFAAGKCRKLWPYFETLYRLLLPPKPPFPLWEEVTLGWLIDDNDDKDWLMETGGDRSKHCI